MAARRAKRGPKKSLFLATQSFKTLTVPSRTVTNVSLEPNSMPKNSSICEKRSGEPIKIRLKIVAMNEKTIRRTLKIKKNILRTK